MDHTLKLKAQKYIRGVYCGPFAAVLDVADENIVSSYPVFQQIFGDPAIKGLHALEAFAAGFSQRWTESKVAFHEIIAEGQVVVLLWSFTARRVETDQEHQWGGITWVRFNKAGKVVAEIGEESSPGPVARFRSVS